MASKARRNPNNLEELIARKDVLARRQPELVRVYRQYLRDMQRYRQDTGQRPSSGGLDVPAGRFAASEE
jgi:hypothetical protein